MEQRLPRLLPLLLALWSTGWATASGGIHKDLPAEPTGWSPSESVGRQQVPPVGEERVAGLSAEIRARYLEIMLRGSLQVSRSKVAGRRFIAPESTPDSDIATIAESNFRDAAAHILDQFHELPLNLATAIELNGRLTHGLVPASSAATVVRSTAAVITFFAWLQMPEADALARRDTVALAEKVHHDFAKFEAFPDGNGRTARLLADLVLLKHGRAPAFYTDIQDYFARGSYRALCGRDEQRRYFREVTRRGAVAAVAGVDAVAASAPSLSPEYLEALRNQPIPGGHRSHGFNPTKADCSR